LNRGNENLVAMQIKNPLSEVKQSGILYRARDFLNPQYFDCISIGPSIAIFSDSSLMSIESDVTLADYQGGIKLPNPFIWKGSLWGSRVPPRKLASFWPRTVIKLFSWSHNAQHIKQITWSDSIYEKDRSVSILFVLDTNFQLSMYNHRFELIYELTSHYVIPTQTRENNASEYIDNIQSVSNLCFAITKSFGKSEKRRNIIISLGGRSDSIQLYQVSFSYPGTTPRVIPLKNIELGLRVSSHHKEAKYRQVVSLSWKHIKLIQSEEKDTNYFLLLIGFNDGSLRYLPVKIIESKKNVKMVHKTGALTEILKADFSSIESISFSKIFVETPSEGLHIFAMALKQYVFNIIRLTVHFVSKTEKGQDQISMNIKYKSRTVRPFESPITVARWLNHSLGIITASKSYQVRYWQAGVDLSINLESDLALPVKEGVAFVSGVLSSHPPIYGLEISPNDAILIIYSQNSHQIDTVELSSSPVDYFHPIEKLLRTQIDPTQGHPFNNWDLDIKFSSKPFHEIFGVINHIKSTFLESYQDKPLTQNVIYMLWRIYQIIILLCQGSDLERHQEEHQHHIALYISHHAHVAYILSICRNLNELKKLVATEYKINEEEKLSLSNIRLQIKQRLGKINESYSFSNAPIKNEIDLTSNEGNSMDVIGEIEEIQEDIAGHFEGEVKEDTPEWGSMDLFPFPPHQLNIESLVVADMIEKCKFIDSLLKDYQLPPLHCPYCHQLISYDSMTCSKHHSVELCMRTFLPLIDARNLLKCHKCNVSAIDLSHFEAFKWIYNENKCAISGHKIQKIKFS